MKLLLKNAQIVNVFTDRLEEANILIDGEKIIGVGQYKDEDADTVRDLSGKIICPGFIDGHIHIESTMLTPAELAKVSLHCGTTAIIADPHEIANVCGVSGITYMLEASENLPLSVFIMLPSCVPSTPFDETGAVLGAEDLRPLYDIPRVLGLGEMMNYPGVLAEDAGITAKITEACGHKKIVNGHAPLLTGRDLDKYISSGISDADMALAANRIRTMGGGNVVVSEGEIMAEMALPIAGLMSDLPAEEVAVQNEKVRKAVHTLGASDEIEPFMNMAFLSLPVIPDIKMTTLGLVDVNSQMLLPLFAD